MSDLHPIPLPDLLRRMRAEVSRAGAIFDLPIRKWFIPDGIMDFSAVHFSRRAATPVGPAAGPHTQLAQNIVLAWLAGGRILELKTVQVLDDLEIPRPCIHIPNVGYNVEWSQELKVRDSLREYAKAAFLIEVLKQTRGFGAFPTDAGFETIFDISVGYDLDGIRSEKVTDFIRSLQDSTHVFEELKAQLSDDLAEFREVELPSSISDCVTLSTFHGCPADQIEAIALYLMEELGLHVILKLNPTLLGFDEVEHLLHDRMGYTGVGFRKEAFEADLKYEDGLGILRRLWKRAEGLGVSVGAKFTNTLVVENDPGIFPSQVDPYMYLSGPPLHVISMTLMQRFREELEFDFPVSFSAGIDAKNFPTAVACGMVPVTTCTDLLRAGGFARLPAYLRALGREMERWGVRSREAYVLACGGNGPRAAEEALATIPTGKAVWRDHGEELTSVAQKRPDAFPETIRRVATDAGMEPDAVVVAATRIAGRLNGRDIVGHLPTEDRYHFSKNSKPPRQVESVLELYDCLNCDLCLSACPNDAIFVYDTEPLAVETEQFLDTSGMAWEKAEGVGFSIETNHQLAVFDGACNECSNCELYCPEVGAPFKEKERVFSTEALFQASAADGFFGNGTHLMARLDGRSHLLEVRAWENRARWFMGEVAVELQWEPLKVLGSGPSPGADSQVESRREYQGSSFDTATVWRMKTAWESIYHSERPNPVNPGGR